MRRTTWRTIVLAGPLLAGSLLAGASAARAQQLPVIDMHLHALAADAQGPPPLGMCTPLDPYPPWDPAVPFPAAFLERFRNPPCPDPVWSPSTDDALKAGDPAASISPDSLRRLHAAGRLHVLGEITNQYRGIAPDDPRMDPYWQLAQELDIPVAIHIGTGPPGAIYLGARGYRARLHSALTLEEVLVRHPGLRVYIMHAGYPMLEDLLAVLYAHPHVYVDLGVIVFTQPRAAFYRYLEAIFDAGFGKRVMFGSDQMVWPGVIERSIAVIENAPFLSAEEKRDVLYDNAARFLRLSPEVIARHHAGRR